MELKARRTVGVFAALMYFLSIFAASLFVTFGQKQTTLRTVPQEMTLGSPALEDITDTEFTIAVVVENVTDLWCFDVQFCWNMTYLDYVNHTVTVPEEDYPDLIPPSPYTGILHFPTTRVKEVVDESGIPLAELGTMAWFIYSDRAGSPPFDGSGTLFIMSVRVKYQPYIYELPSDEDHVNLSLCFTSTELGDEFGQLIPHTSTDGIIKLYARTPSPDINNDGIVNLYDVVIAANAYGSHVGDPEWNQLADLAPEWGKIDIYDLVTCLYHYGEK
jgi:hypothetical protein